MSRLLPALLPPLLDAGSRVSRLAVHVPAGPALAIPPMPTMPSDRTGDTTYGFSRMDRDGRIAAGDVGPVLDWPTGTRLAAVYRGHSVVLSPKAGGQVILRGSWHLRLPAAIRHWALLH